MNKKIDIYSAINNLPNELITPEIYEAGIKEANIKILDLLPEEYLTEDNINAILDSKENNYSWNTFSLSAIPEKAKTQKVCNAAVEKSLDNYLTVPEKKRTNDMLLKIMGRAENHIHFLSHVPASTWDEKAVYTGILSIYNSGGTLYNYGRSYPRSTTNKETQMKLIQILLAYVPEEIKTKSFYFGFFATSMDVKDVDFLTPNKYKKADYYLEMGKKSIGNVPVEKLTYDIIKAALLSNNNPEGSFWGGWREETHIKEPMLKLMDDKMADIIVKRCPDNLSLLPEEFQTKNRLILALETNISNSSGSRNASRIYSSFDISKFDDDICKAVIRQEEYDCPKFAPEIWTDDFVNYCMENAKSYWWFRQMPKELQTQEIADKALDASIRNIEYIKPEFISYETAVTVFRYCNSYDRSRYEYREYTPKHYMDDFNMETGLPKEFFGGETTYFDLRNNRDNYKYCQIGECYIGLFIDKDGRNEYNRLIMTRRTPMQIKPSIVFNRTIGTFHKTWLEKLVADNDSLFAKPVPAKGLKSSQTNPYMNVQIIDSIDRIKIYGHSFLGETLLYTVTIDGYNNEYASLDEARQICKKNVEELEIAS